MDLTRRITDVWAGVNSISNWDQHHFDWTKAYVASVFAKIAYLHIPQYELKNANRANLIPCMEYREIIRRSRGGSVDQVLIDSDFGEFFVVEKPYALAVVVRVRDVLFISLRGTQQLYDWLVNLNVSRSRPYADVDVDIFFHKGFHRAAASCMYEIHAEILKRYGKDSIIYVTGHSLGGALAAILHALWCRGSMNRQHIGCYPWAECLATHSCYTFGMPRYGNFHAVEHFANPFHIYNQFDTVPAVPPKVLGFDDSLIEYCLTAEGKVDGSCHRSSSFSRFIIRLATLKAIREHDMEIYMDRTKRVSNVD